MRLRVVFIYIKLIRMLTTIDLSLHKRAPRAPRESPGYVRGTPRLDFHILVYIKQTLNISSTIFSNRGIYTLQTNKIESIQTAESPGYVQGTPRW